VGSQPLDGKRELAPFSFVRRLRWYMMTLMDAQEKEEAPRSTLRERKPLTKFANFMALICSIIDSVTSSIQGAADQRCWRDASERDDVCDIVLGLEEEPVPCGSSRSTFLSTSVLCQHVEVVLNASQDLGDSL
jgi:hypothetical protein